jgi:hypothetical protein
MPGIRAGGHVLVGGASLFIVSKSPTVKQEASRLFELMHGNRCDTAVVISGDSDLVPAMQTAARLFPNKKTVSVSPFHRVSRELRQVAAAQFKVSAAHYLRHQLPDPFRLADGREMAKPETW